MDTYVQILANDREFFGYTTVDLKDNNLLLSIPKSGYRNIKISLPLNQIDPIVSDEYLGEQRIICYYHDEKYIFSTYGLGSLDQLKQILLKSQQRNKTVEQVHEETLASLTV